MKLMLWINVFLLICGNFSKGATFAKDSLQNSIHFVQGVSWARILDKAKKERKFIFIDCYATWCGPCKKMDKEVYSISEVGNYYNDRFICVKMQMDKTKSDPDSIRTEYVDAANLASQYHINGYPTLLYLDSDGRLLKRVIGAMDVAPLLSAAADVVNPDLNYYKLLDSFNSGVLQISRMAPLATTALSIGDTTEGYTIARRYMKHLGLTPLLSKDDIQFLSEFTRSSRDIGFKFFSQYADIINKKVSDDTYAQAFIFNLVIKEILDPEMTKIKSTSKAKVDWRAIQRKVVARYGEYYANRAITFLKVKWAGEHKDWAEWAKYYVRYEEAYGSKTNTGKWQAYHLNTAAWAIFTYSGDLEALDHALAWSGRAMLMDPEPTLFDTYANILYKRGQKGLAIQWETMALKLEPEEKEIAERLQKMQLDRPTWPKID